MHARGAADRAARAALPILISLLLPAAGRGPVTVSAASAPAETSGEQDRIEVFVGIAPIAYLAERVGGGRVRVEVLIPPGQSPHTFEPTPRQMTALAESRLFCSVGLPFETRLLERLAELAEDLTIVDTSKNVPRLAMGGAHGHDTQGHEPAERLGTSEAETDADHTRAASEPERSGTDVERGLPDPHVWMSPRNASHLAGAIGEALTDLDPAGAAVYRSNLDALEEDLERLDAAIAEALAPVAGETFYVFHPAFGYFADAYGLHQEAVEVGGHEPGARQLAGLTARAREAGVRVIFVQPQLSSRTAEAIAQEIGGAVVPIDPLAYDYLDNLRAMAESVRAALTSRDTGARDPRE